MMRVRSLRRLRFVRGERGAALVEFAIVLPLLLLIVFGIIDFARAFYTQNNLTSAVREGARWAAVRDLATINAAGIQAIVQRFANADSTAATKAKFGGPGVAAAQISYTITPNLTTPEFVTVTITDYPFDWWTPLPGMVGFGNIGLSAEAVFRLERGKSP